MARRLVWPAAAVWGNSLLACVTAPYTMHKRLSRVKSLSDDYTARLGSKGILICKVRTPVRNRATVFHSS